jgi:hypothetical protein
MGAGKRFTDGTLALARAGLDFSRAIELGPHLFSGHSADVALHSESIT